MDNIVYSRKAFEDLQQLKFNLIQIDEVQALITLNSIVDDICKLEKDSNFENNDKIFKYREDTYYIVTNKYFVFFRREGEKIKVDRVLNKELDYIKLVFESIE